MEQTDQNYRALLSEVIKKQIVILGPDITLLKARNVKGLTVADDGTVTQITGEPQVITQNLIDQFVQLSGLIVKKTMEPLLAYHAEGAAPQPQVVVSAPVIPQTVQPANNPPAQAPQMPSQVIPPAPVQQPTGQVVPQSPTMNVSQPNDTQFHPEQVDISAQKIIDEALKDK